jgi:hypothetical protein
VERNTVLYEWEVARLVFGRNTGYRIAYTTRGQFGAETRRGLTGYVACRSDDDTRSPHLLRLNLNITRRYPRIGRSRRNTLSQNPVPVNHLPP